MPAISIRPNLSGLHKAALDFGGKQMPFATALALTSLAKGAATDERVEVDATFDHPTRFTENAFAIQPATKAKPVAVVFAKDIQASYPYILSRKTGFLLAKATV